MYVCIYMYVCMYVCMYVLYIYIYIYIYACYTAIFFFKTIWYKTFSILIFLILLKFLNAQEALADLSVWLRDGKIVFQTDVVDGLENAPKALLR